MAGWKLALEGRASIVWTEQEFKRLKPSGQSGARGKAVVKKTLELSETQNLSILGASHFINCFMTRVHSSGDCSN